jgi:hypothetical protein
MICRLLVEEGLPFARFAWRVSSSLSACYRYCCCGLSRFYPDRVVDTLPNYSFPVFAELFPWKRLLLTLQRGWLRYCGNVFIRPLLSTGCLLSCDWPAPEIIVGGSHTPKTVIEFEI